MAAELAALFGWSFAAATILPLSSEVPLAYLVHRRGELAWAVVGTATLGNLLGAFTTYWMARGALGVIRARRSPPEASPRRQRALEAVRRWGAPALLFSWVPILGDALVAAAGALRLPFVPVSVCLLVGKVARYLIVAWAALELLP